MTRPADLGASIAESFRFVSSVATECDALLKLSKEEVSRMLLEPDIRQVFSATGEWVLSYEEDDTGWLNTGLAASLALKQGRRKTPSGYLFIQISLSGGGINALSNLEPLVHIGWWHDPIVFGEISMGFPLEAYRDCQLRLEESVLFRWTHKTATDEWCYSLRLTDVNALKDIKALMVEPLKHLLLGHPASNVLGNLPVVRFSPVESEPGQFFGMPR